MKINNEFKLTVANVAKLTYTITLGIALGKLAAKAVKDTIAGIGKGLMDFAVEQLEKTDIGKTIKVDYDAEFDKAVEDHDAKTETEGEPES